jgi:hypothetical protein
VGKVIFHCFSKLMGYIGSMLVEYVISSYAGNRSFVSDGAVSGSFEYRTQKAVKKTILKKDYENDGRSSKMVQ